MYIEKISIKNFRNIKQIDLKLEKKINFIIGDNAQGKTNFIEAIYFSAFLKSFRTQKLNDIIKEGEKTSYLNISTLKNNVLNNSEIYFDNKNKNIKLNGKNPDNKNYFKYLNIVLFHPDEVNYITSYPSFRRNLIDRSIFYTDYDYLDTYKKYYRCLRQRNNLLKTKSNITDVWEEQLIIYGSEIVRKRNIYIDKINSLFMSDFFISSNKERYSVKYSRNYSECGSVEEHLAAEFTRKRERERLLGQTLVGPHKDDLKFYLNGKPAETFASQGQKRSLVISFKTAQILDYKAIQGHYPVLILDDMSSELDKNRKNALLENLLQNSGQVFITATDFLKTNLSERSNLFRVNNGEISLAD